MKKVSEILWGLLFLIVGVILATNALEITNINIFFKGWWTLFIIVPCFIGLFSSKNKTGSIIGLVIGVALLLCSRGILSYEIIRKLTLPTVFIIIGVCIIFGSSINRKVNAKIKELNKTGMNEYYATFGEQKVDYTNQKMEGASLSAIFGGVTFDFSNSIINQDAVINASAIFGGITIIAPKNVNIVVKSTPIFGGVSDKTVKNVGDNIITVYVNAVCMFGGVDIK